MPFSDLIKKEVRERSRHCCVFCKKFFLPTEVHHIKPEAPGGPNTIENAVLLCRNHHSQFGHNPDFIDYIIKERDNWYSHCEKYMADSDIINKEIEDMAKRIKTLEGEQKTPNITMTKETLINGIDTLISNLQDIKKSLDKEKVTPTDISSASLNMSGQAVNADYLGSYGISSVNAEVVSSPSYTKTPRCPTCNSDLYEPIPEICPICRTPLGTYLI